MKSSLKNMVLVLLLISTITAFLVALVNDLTKDAIAESNTKAKNMAKYAVLGTNDTEATILRDTTCTIGDFAITVSTVVRNDDQTVIGYAVEAPSITKSGYADRITLMVGFKEEGEGAVINAVEVLSQKETPGLGANMTKAGNSLERSIVAKDPATLTFAVTKEGGSFDALTGSTISSRAYANAVETAYAGYLWATGRLNTEAQAESMTGSTIQSDSNLM